MDIGNGEFPSQVYSMDEKSNDSKQQKRSVKSYASRVFQESTIGIVASIASSHSNARRLFKSFVLIMCLTGFTYQCVTFLLHVFEYPTNVDIDIQKPKLFNSPGFTFCNNNGMKRSVFCDMFPNRCYQPSEKFCSRFHNYCGKNDTTLVPNNKYYNLENSLTFDEILQLGDDKSDFLPKINPAIVYVECNSILSNENFGKQDYLWSTHTGTDSLALMSSKERDRSISVVLVNDYWNEIKGPYMRTVHVFSGAMLCYTLHSVVDSSENPRQLEHSDSLISRKEPSTDITFYVREDEMFIPGSRPGVLFSIHSPYEAVNPFEKGIFLKPGRNYKIFITMVEEVLLKDPFLTDCVNYEEAWEANNRTGPRIQEMCKEKCVLEAFLTCFNCVGAPVLYPSTNKICNMNDYNGTGCPDEAKDALDACLKSCKDDCRVTKYTPEIMERYQVDYTENEDLDDYERYIKVEIILEAGEVMTLKHSPKYMTVEVFSNIGGFIGCWLGIALMDIIDVLASAFSVSRYAFRQYRKQ